MSGVTCGEDALSACGMNTNSQVSWQIQHMNGIESTDIIDNVINFLKDARSLCRVEQTCKLLNGLCNNSKWYRLCCCRYTHALLVSEDLSIDITSHGAKSIVSQLWASERVRQPCINDFSIILDIRSNGKSLHVASVPCRSSPATFNEPFRFNELSVETLANIYAYVTICRKDCCNKVRMSRHKYFTKAVRSNSIYFEPGPTFLKEEEEEIKVSFEPYMSKDAFYLDITESYIDGDGDEIFTHSPSLRDDREEEYYLFLLHNMCQ